MTVLLIPESDPAFAQVIGPRSTPWAATPSMPRHDELTVLMRSARQLSKLCRDGAALVAEAREHHAAPT